MSSDHVQLFRNQASACALLGSPFTAALLTRAADDFERIAPLLAWKDDWSANDASPLRFAGALNAAAILGRAPGLAAQYPAACPDWDIEAVWREAINAIEADRDWFERFLHHPPQTNEVRRSIALLPAFIDAAQAGALHLLEIGASAGLNLYWDRFAFVAANWTIGPQDGPRIDTDWRGAEPPLDIYPHVASRAGCDLHPLDIRNADQRARLKAYIWPDQFDRVTRFEQVAKLAIENYVGVAAEDVGTWLSAKLAGELPDGVTLIYHSIAWQYFTPETAERAKAAIAAAAARATPKRQLAWARFEVNDVLGYPEQGFSVDLAVWPGQGEFRRVAKADPHARWVEVLPAS